MPAEYSPSYANAGLTVTAILAVLSLGAVAIVTSTPAASQELVSSIVRGGRLYDNWYQELRRPVPDRPHPAYPADKTFADDPATNWRCKECHGWDYLGRDGAYATGDHFTGITGIRGMVGADPADIIAVLKDDTHAYGGLMNDADFEDLAHFVSKGQVEMERFIDPVSKTSKGDSTKNQEHFKTICATCHGTDGAIIGTMPPLGRVANENPWEALHKILNGHPAGKMPALRVLDPEVVANILAYVQTLPAETEILSSIIRGGRLYDNWLETTGGSVPAKPHPAYPADKMFADAPEINWRCQACHGWDYRGKDGAFGGGEHFTGINGIRGMAGADPARIIAVLTDDTHRYRGVLESHDIEDLANFVSKGQVEMDRFIDRDTGLAKGDAARHESHYTTVCANCHGKNGTRYGTLPRPLGNVANDNPWMALHKMLNGHPAGEMPALRVFDMEVVADILAYLQTLPREDEQLSSVDRGGRLYDNWYKVLGAGPPERSHPAYPADSRYADDPDANWRCKECHGWDYRGRDGAYGAGKHFTGIKGIRGMAGEDPARIVAVLKDDTHQYGDVLDARDLTDLANFVGSGQFDMHRYIDPATGAAKGDKTRQAAYFVTICADCHGKDGTEILTMVPLGRVAKSNPWEALHKIVNGQPDEDMAALRILDMQVLVDILAYAQALPEER
jgi:mono/diheme cytochrome c family protein